MMLCLAAGFYGNITPYQTLCQLATQDNGIFRFCMALQRTQPYSRCADPHKLAAHDIVDTAFLVIHINARRMPENVSNHPEN